MTKIIIELEINGDGADAYEVVNNLLDDGAFQDAINDTPGLEVQSAVVRFEEPRRISHAEHLAERGDYERDLRKDRDG